MCLFRESCRLKKRVKLAYPNMILNIIKPYFCKIDRVNGSCVVLARFSSGKESFSIKRNYAACLAEYLCKSLCFHRFSFVPWGWLLLCYAQIELSHAVNESAQLIYLPFIFLLLCGGCDLAKFGNSQI